MNVTFERRLNTRPVRYCYIISIIIISRSRLGAPTDLRSKIRSNPRNLDARSILRNRQQTRTNVRDARTILQSNRRSRQQRTYRRMLPFIVPTKTVRYCLACFSVSLHLFTDKRRYTSFKGYATCSASAPTAYVYSNFTIIIFSLSMQFSTYAIEFALMIIHQKMGGKL